ncbi:KaiC domain-containing protein [Natranaeroarchaeum aerophilus]|uniref:KaiC domain-containing protein n=1 Tax=Natranaeroarchaeum aerophilus TaxID=2917711 RepID=A0AAE3FMK2_9EURY|nr:KaiC domain-containing protein [Natranaeroarchaeum aerophilus]MCL9812437.1 KaiC domain-containing protein [Natranaeroarchaeum aerophilus]
MDDDEPEEDWFEQDADDQTDDLFVGEWAVEAEDDTDGADREGTTGDSDDEAAESDPMAFSEAAESDASTAFDEAAADLEEAFEDIADEEADTGADYGMIPTAETASDPEGEEATGDDTGEGLFDQGFGEALGSAPDLPAETTDDIDDDLGDEFDFGGEFDMGTDDFETLDSGGFEEDPDSDIDRIALGIEGLDAMIQGGVPAQSLMVAIGSAGTGKTTLGLQFLAEGLRNGERGVYITLEESRRRVIRSATEKGFAFDEYADAGDLAVVDIDPVEMANSLQSIRSELPRLVDEFGASRLVLDSVSLLEMMYDERATRRNQIYNFTKSLKQSGVTTLMTSEASEDTAFASRHGIVEYLTDAVFVLRYIRPSDFRETQMAIEIQKIRDANHSRETKPYEITSEGINVYRQANIF